MERAKTLIESSNLQELIGSVRRCAEIGGGIFGHIVTQMLVRFQDEEGALTPAQRDELRSCCVSAFGKQIELGQTHAASEYLQVIDYLDLGTNEDLQAKIQMAEEENVRKQEILDLTVGEQARQAALTWY